MLDFAGGAKVVSFYSSIDLRLTGASGFFTFFWEQVVLLISVLLSRCVHYCTKARSKLKVPRPSST